MTADEAAATVREYIADSDEETNAALDVLVSAAQRADRLAADMQFVNDVSMSWHGDEDAKARALNVIATRSSAALADDGGAG